MRRSIGFGPFGGVVTSLGGRTGKNDASEILNVLTARTRLEPRRGMAQLLERYAGPVKVRALMALSGYDDAYAPKAELLKIETRTPVTPPGAQPRTYPLTTPIPPRTPVSGEPPTVAEWTEVTNGTKAISLPELPLSGFVFDGYGYIVQPGAEKTLYRHEIGKADSWEAIGDTVFVVTPDSPDLILSGTGPTERKYHGATVTTSAGDFGGDAATVNAQGQIVVTSSSANRTEDGTMRVLVTFAEPIDLRPYGALSVAVQPGTVMPFFRGNEKIAFKRGGTFENPDTAALPAKIAGTHNRASEGMASTDLLSITVDLRTAGTLEAVQGFTLFLQGYVSDDTQSGTVLTVMPMQLWGGYLLAPTPTAKPWDAEPATGEIRYAARLRNAAGQRTPIEEASVNEVGVTGALVRGGHHRAGETIRIAWPGFDSATYPRATSVVEWLRFDGAKWRKLGESPSNENAVWRDSKRLHEVTALGEATGLEGYVPPPPKPPFTARGLLGGVPYKGWVTWLFVGGKGNVRHSKAGEPLELRATNRTYDEDDETQPADSTLADGFDDEPVAGFQAGQLLVILGKAGVYTSYGDSPRTMTPPRRVPETSGPVHARACCRWKAEQGGYGVAWIDATGNLWGLLNSPRFEGDASARAIELSIPVRGLFSSFLGSNLTGVALQYDEADDALFAILGRRAIVMRPGDREDGNRRFECYEYAVVEDGYGVMEWTEWSPASNATQSGPGVTWDEGPPDELTLEIHESSKVLMRDGFLVGMLPDETTVYEIEARVRESSEGDVTRLGFAHATHDGPTQTETDPNGVSVLPFHSGPEADLAIIESGALAASLQVSTGTCDPDDWTFAFSGPQTVTDWHTREDVHLLPVSAAYVGDGIAPPSVTVVVEGSVVVQAHTYPGPSYISFEIDNGLGYTFASHGTGFDFTPQSYEYRSSGTVTIPLTNGVGSKAVEMRTTMTNHAGDPTNVWMVEAQVHDVALACDGSEWYDPSNWTYSPAPPLTYGIAPHLGETIASHTFAVTATYVGPGIPPPTVNAGASLRSEGGFTGGGPRTGTFTGTDPFGTTVAPIYVRPLQPGDPANVVWGVRESYGVLEDLPVYGRTTVISVPMSISVLQSVNAHTAGTMALLSAGIVPPDPASYSGTLEMRARYGDGIPDFPGRFDAVAFDRGRSWALRSDGVLLLLERGLDGAPLVGPLRDAGQPMPEGRWLSGWIEGPRSRPADVRAERTPEEEALVFLGRTPIADYEAVAPSGRAYARFPVESQATRWRFGVRVTESIDSVDALLLDLVSLPAHRADRG